MEVFYQNRPSAITPGEAATTAAVVETFVRATETSNVERRLKIIETELPAHPENVSKMFGARAGGQFNPQARICARSALDFVDGRS
jgi:hypothetical protein